MSTIQLDPTQYVYMYRDFIIRPAMLLSMERYVEEGHPVGGFLQAVIRNDLKGAVEQADYENSHNLPAFLAWFFNEAPAMCWGRPESYEAWVAMGGKAGVERTKLASANREAER